MSWYVLQSNSFMTDRRHLAWLARVLCLVVIVTGMFILAYVSGQLIVWDDPAKTFDNILGHETLYRFGLARGTVCYLFFIFSLLALYDLLKSIYRFFATSMVLLASISVPISLYNLTNKYAILDLLAISDQVCCTVDTGSPAKSHVLPESVQ